MLKGITGILVPGGFGYRGIEGKIRAIEFARKNKVPFLGLCLGMQCAVIEFARNACGLKDANSSEFKKNKKSGYQFAARTDKCQRFRRHDALRRLPLQDQKQYPGIQYLWKKFDPGTPSAQV